ncbi:MAG: hypothetical protein R3D33_18750 [Hyphomicrobiaceae bacterium]
MTRTMTTTAFAALALLAAGLAGTPEAAAASPSFSCKGRLTATERAICDSPVLSSLDRQMAREYAHRMGSFRTSEGRSSLKAAQRGWLATRNSCGASKGCLRAEYEDWISQLVEWDL